MKKPTILTGLRANNDLTIGNYFGAILPMIDMVKQKSADYQINMFIPDLHSFTTPIDHSKLYDQILHNARLFVAAGLPLNNDNIHLYRQSHVSAHSELTWILDCFTGFGEMNRMTEFKDKSAKIGDDRVSVGLFNYPVLMAADILLYNAELVPVGDDQRQHLEFARDIAERMNSRFGDIFTVPLPVAKQHEFFGKDQGLRIKDLQNPLKKMSKSDDSGKGVIFLGDDPAVATKKVMSATTDDKAEIHFDRENQPGISNLLEILALLRGGDLQQTIGEFEGQTSYGDFKKTVAGEVEKFLTDFQAQLNAIDDTTVLEKLTTSERAMNIVANETLLRAQQVVGLRPRGN
ncbi:MAG TPA: tryptophan--tRNA ligase [Candidatus Saccharimonadales bacterium]|nr:tryptophan--tRNA ligase [Candidatus Saccharimonadales bacterium]